MLSNGSETTEHIGEQVGRKLRGGEVIELLSDLGGGKTTFVRGLARGAGSQSHVSSPTFKISNEYETLKGHIVHYDFYRLTEAGPMEHELTEAFSDPHNVYVVEWGDVVKDVLPKERLTIQIRTKSEAEREIEFNCPESLTYLLEGVA